MSKLSFLSAFSVPHGLQDRICKGLDPVSDAVPLHGRARTVARFHDAEVSWEIKSLVHVQGRDELAGNEVAAGITGNDDGKQGLIIKSRGTE